jgi:hypothetical protein
MKNFHQFLILKKNKIDENQQELQLILNDLELTEENKEIYSKIDNYKTKLSELKSNIKDYIDKVELINNQFRTEFVGRLKNKFTGIGFTNLVFLFIFLLLSSTECYTRTNTNLFIFGLSFYWLLSFIITVFLPINKTKWIMKIIDFFQISHLNLMVNIYYIVFGFLLSLSFVLFIKFQLSNYWFDNELIFGFKNLIVLTIPIISIIVCGLKIRTIYQDVLDDYFSNRDELMKKIPKLQFELNSIATTIEQTRNASNFEVSSLPQ